ncbi:SGT1-domain-containing protein [Trichocladium antarcticum]|uniref:SGT1-domain-containing protein n=1 Tax=Trichocladium antarcticum TaxID=1450529 RepID=A0AAN6UNT4_9PEZI|nr:SGT1-domain-containing protein [Trichocladium antarcticum]
MDTAPELRPGDDGFEGFQMRLAEDCVEYMLFVIRDKTDSQFPSLETVKKAADQKLEELAKDYIWQREPFKLETKVQKGLGLPYLQGTTRYGDNVEDEWLIVYLLRELSKSFPSLWVRVADSDGEFLLIEAAKVTPKWLSPENDTNRVWIHDGKLLIIPLSNNISSPLSLQDAIETIKSSPASLIHSTFIEAESFYRLEKYPAQIRSSLHHSRATIPRKLAYILHARPKAIAPATEAFYLRDPRALKPLLSPAPTPPLVFPPTDLVTISVRFTRVLYAQLKSQHFARPPAAWRGLLDTAEVEVATTASTTTTTTTTAGPAKSTAEERLAQLEMGVKVTTGFELLARAAHESASRVAREVALLLEDLAEDGGDAALPGDEEIRGWEGVAREDDDSWMDIDYRDFEKELGGGKGTAGFGDAGTQADLQKIVSRFEAFLNDDKAGIDGIDVDEMDRDDDSDEDDDEDVWEDDDEDEDKEVGFNEEQFAKMMREMMGLPSEDGGREKGKQKAVLEEVEKESDEGGDEDEDGDEKFREIMAQMESELKSLGALDLDPKSKGLSSIKEKGEGPEAGPASQKEDGDEESGDDAVDIDYNLAKNLLESFKSQAGMAGPAGNLLGLMGMTLPRDEEDSGDDQK